MEEFKSASLNIDVETPAKFMIKYNVDFTTALQMIAQVKAEMLVVNDVYRVSISQNFPTHREGWPNYFHLTVTRHDQKPIDSWDDLYTIKNLLVGKEHEAIEIYPADSRLVNMGNQRHLWVFVPENFTIPIGWNTRMVEGEQ